MEQAKSAVERVYTCIDNLEFLLQNSDDRELTDSEKEYSKTLDDCKAKFIAAMDDDLNTAEAIAAIFDIVYAFRLILQPLRLSTFPVSFGINRVHRQAHV